MCWPILPRFFHRFTLVRFRLKASRSTANAPWTTKKIYRTTRTLRRQCQCDTQHFLWWKRDVTMGLSERFSSNHRLRTWYRLWMFLSFLTLGEKRKRLMTMTSAWLFIIILFRLWLWMLGFLMQPFFIWRITLTTHRYIEFHKLCCFYVWRMCWPLLPRCLPPIHTCLFPLILKASRSAANKI